MSTELTKELRLSTSFYDANGVHIDKAIDFLCDHLIHYTQHYDSHSALTKEEKKFLFFKTGKYTPHTSRELIKKSLKMAAKKSPSARMAIWTTIHDLTYDPKTKTYSTTPQYKPFLRCSDETDGSSYGCVRSSDPNFIHIFPDLIRSSAKKHAERFGDAVIEEATLISIAETLLHEFQHIRQERDPNLKNNKLNLVYFDAAPQALSHQIALESLNPYFFHYYNIPTKKIEEYKKAVDYDEETGAVNDEKARKYSVQNQKNFIRDFSANLGEKPYGDYTSLYTRLIYILNEQIYSDETNDTSTKDDKKSMEEYLKKANQTDIQITDPLPKKIKDILTKKGNKVYKTCNETQIRYLEICLETFQKPNPNDFQGEAYKAALDYYETYVDLKKSIVKLSTLSKKIQDGDKQALAESAILRARLLKEYGLVIHPYNRSNDRVADDVDMAKKKAPNEKENPVLPHEKGPQSDATRAMAEFHAPEGDKAEIHAPTPRNNHNHTA